MSAVHACHLIAKVAVHFWELPFGLAQSTVTSVLFTPSQFVDIAMDANDPSIDCLQALAQQFRPFGTCHGIVHDQSLAPQRKGPGGTIVALHQTVIVEIAQVLAQLSCV